MTLQNKLQGCHEGTNPIFAKIHTLVLKHFTINLLSELQQVRYEQTKMFDEATEVAEKK